MKSIEPVSPGEANATPKYEWDSDDAGQLWITKEAMRRGVEAIYANAWSAPGFMKTNGNDSNGAYLCGVRDADCTTGDWRKAYAEYLVQYLNFYRAAGVNVTHLGFVNEPDLNQTYASMQASGFQIADILSSLHVVLQDSDFHSQTRIVCCEATGWGDAKDILAELQSVPGAEDIIHIYSTHGYSVNPALPFTFQNENKNVWQTEWADLTGRWNPAWDDLGKDGEGISWANKIHQALTLSNISAFFYWIGASEGNSNGALVRILNGTAIPSGRLWAFAHYSKFLRPGSVRVDASCDTSYIKVSAFENTDGRVVVVVINNGHTDVNAEFQVEHVKGEVSVVLPWKTGNGEVVRRGENVPLTYSLQGSTDVRFNVALSKRSMASFVIQ